jgi:hypothetical protein
MLVVGAGFLSRDSAPVKFVIPVFIVQEKDSVGIVPERPQRIELLFADESMYSRDSSTVPAKRIPVVFFVSGRFSESSFGMETSVEVPNSTNLSTSGTSGVPAALIRGVHVLRITKK